MARILTPALLLLLPFALFLAFFNPGTLDIDNPGWLIRDSDNGEGALGAHAYWHDPTSGASLHTHLLNAPEGVPVLYTDSNPLVTLAAKPFASLLPEDAQLFGCFTLLNLFLQAVFAWLLLRRYAPGPLALWTGVALLAFPPTLFNRFIHVNLMAHWTILAALCLYLDERRAARLGWWAPLIAVTALIHSYLLIIVGAIWASKMLQRFREGSARTRKVLVGEGAVILTLVALLASWMGVGGQVSSGAFGQFAMELDALWNPGLDHFTNLLPAHESSPGHGFEGFQYLGAGGLLLIAAALVISRFRPARESEAEAKRTLRTLLPALIVMATIAIMSFPLPAPILTLLDPVRGSGRLFWPMGYVLVFMAVLAVYRLSADRAGLLLLALIALQTIDLSGMAYAIRAQSRMAEQHQLYVRTLDPRWDQLVRQAQTITFIPGDVTRDLGVFQEVAWRAVKAGRPVTNVYAARISATTARRLEVEGTAFARGELVPGRLYVLIGGATIPAVARPFAQMLDGVTVIIPRKVL